MSSQRGDSWTSKVTRLGLTDEVAHWLVGLLLSHDEPDLLGLLVSHESGVSSSSLLQLIVSHSVQLGSHLEDALFVLLTSHFLHFGKGLLYIWSVRLMIGDGS